MNSFEKILLENKAWSEEKKKKDPEFFGRMTQLQKPEFLWIGCSDSRVAVNEITNTNPGDIFVHRNIANLVVHTDLNLLSVLQYAVEILKVKNIIVCGHYQCGGVQAALDTKDLGLINKWLRNIKDVYTKHSAELDLLPHQEKLDRLTEWNVKEQILNLSKTTIIQKSWNREQIPELHGCVYSLKDGIMHEIIYMDHKSIVDPLYKYELSE
ncbi:carbonate dehydratase [Leptospira sp. GIMC2001]|uniref:carbonate dehydratase n=1 Tax=Leptospira sp. GIMC2001 TaxID=1513297 RepID=UPI00234ADE0E|nr:carbonate dehydratase [Leptospira sp. GIMC2001]WCL50356.1 carbonate dehydratase [Leptospira sp. GIMC2001]